MIVRWTSGRSATAWVVWATVFMALGRPLTIRAAEPTTVADAAKRLDLSAFPPAGKVKEAFHGTIAQLVYETEGAIAVVFEQIKQELNKRGWQPLPDGTITDEYASATFANGDSHVSVSVMPGSDPGTCRTTIVQHGNRVLGDLPLPAGAKELFVGPISAMYTIPQAVDQAWTDYDQQLRSAGWIPYGDAVVQRFYKRNALRLTVMITSAPAQNDQTMVQLSTELMSADLPVPPEADQVQYSDSPTQVTFRDPRKVDDMLKTYGPQLTAIGWKATTEQPIKERFEQFQIFRNAAGEMLELELRPLGDDGTRVSAHFSTAKDVERMQQAVDQAVKRP
jgi:hypothetical protein